MSLPWLHHKKKKTVLNVNQNAECNQDVSSLRILYSRFCEHTHESLYGHKKIMFVFKCPGQAWYIYIFFLYLIHSCALSASYFSS